MMSMLGMLGAGLVTTGMVHGVTREGYARFRQVNWVFTGIVLALMALLSIPPLAHCWLGGVLGLPASIEHPAYQAFAVSLVLQPLFFLRNPYQVCLYIHGATTLASTATITRIVCTLLLVPVFIHVGLVGPIWAVVAQVVAVSLEVLLSWVFARPYIRKLPRDARVSATREGDDPLHAAAVGRRLLSHRGRRDDRLGHRAHAPSGADAGRLLPGGRAWPARRRSPPAACRRWYSPRCPG